MRSWKKKKHIEIPLLTIQFKWETLLKKCKKSTFLRIFRKEERYTTAREGNLLHILDHLVLQNNDQGRKRSRSRKKIKPPHHGHDQDQDQEIKNVTSSKKNLKRNPLNNLKSIKSTWKIDLDQLSKKTKMVTWGLTTLLIKVSIELKFRSIKMKGEEDFKN